MTSFTHAVCENEPRLWGTHNSRTYSSVYTIFALTTLFLSIWFNCPKFSVIQQCKEKNISYTYPIWAQHQIESQSSNSWLANHLFVSLTNVMITSILILFGIYVDPEGNSEIYKNFSAAQIFIQIFFCIHVFMNMNHLGSLSSQVAFLINWAAMLGVIVSWGAIRLGDPLRLSIYLFIFSLPVYIEAFSYMVVMYLPSI